MKSIVIACVLCLFAGVAFATDHVVRQNNKVFVVQKVVVDGRHVQKVVVDNRVVAVVPLFNVHGFNNFLGNRLNVYGGVNYGAQVLGFTDFDFVVNKQFYDNRGNLIRQFVVNGFVVAQEVVQQKAVVQFVQAFKARNFVLLRQLRNTSCSFSQY